MSPPSRKVHEPRSPLRIAVLVTRFPELSQTFVLDQLVALRDGGFEIQVYASKRSQSGLRHPAGRELLKHARFMGVGPLSKLSKLPFIPAAIGARVRRAAVRRSLRSAGHGADLLLCHFGPNGLAAANALQGSVSTVPIWTIFHGYDLSQWLKKHGQDAYSPLFAAGDKFLPISRLWANKLRELGCPEGRIQLLRMGVDCDHIGFEPATWAPGDPVRILSVGRLVQKKGAQHSIRALARVARTCPELAWQLEIAGDGPLEQELRELVGENGLQDKIKLLGPLSSDEVRDRLRKAHLFLLPSVVAPDGDMEGIPVSLMEAMAAGVPVVSTFHSGIPELVEHNVSGLLAPEGDEDALAQHLEQLIREPELRRSLARAARIKVEQEFNQKQINEEFVELIRKNLDRCAQDDPDLSKS